MDTKTFLNSAEFAVSFFNNLPTEQFNNALKINRSWYKECARELRVRQRIATEKYEIITDFLDKAQEIVSKETKNNYHIPYSKREIILKEFIDKRDEMYHQKAREYDTWAEVDKACIRCGFFDLIIDKERLNRWKSVYKYGSIKFRKFILPDYEAIVIATIDALKEVIKSAHNQRFKPTNYLITDNIKIIKEIRSANNPEQYILSLAKEIFPDHCNTILYTGSYHGDLFQKFKKLHRLYYNIAKGLDWQHDWLENK